MKIIDLEKLLPGTLPIGERVLWHGRPNWVALARHAYRADLVAAWFAVIGLWSIIADGFDSGWAAPFLGGLKSFALALVALGLLGLLAWLSSRTTLYVITSRRIVMKIGVALPIFFNLPFTEITAAAVLAYRNGAGDLSLTLRPSRRIAYFHLWPHARPFRFKNPEPTLRAVPDAARVADILGDALRAEANVRRGLPSPTAHSTSPVLPPGYVAA